MDPGDQILYVTGQEMLLGGWHWMSLLCTLGVPQLSGITSLTVIQVLQVQLLRQLSAYITADIIFRQI